MSANFQSALNAFIQNEKLPSGYAETVQQWFIPLAEELMHKTAVRTEAMVVGISGCQGSGKSTLASLLVLLLREMIGLNSINLSIDDFYLPHAERQFLSKNIHPLLATRGVPGTHDVSLAIDTINSLRQAKQVAIPRFNKAKDDRLPQSEWPTVQGPVDVIILEGWCLNIGAQKAAALTSPVNELEKNEDPQGAWRHYVNEQLINDYPALYNLVDYLVMLKAPSFEKVFDWRQTQEDKLAKQYAENAEANKIMSKAELKRFIQHYERLTRHGLQTLPKQADIIFELSNEQTILGKG